VRPVCLVVACATDFGSWECGWGLEGDEIVVLSGTVTGVGWRMLWFPVTVAAAGGWTEWICVRKVTEP
jgi:hypothetical protein